MKHQEITEKIIKAFYAVYNEPGHGFLESVYEQSMAIALRQEGLPVTQQAPVAVYFRGQLVGDFRADVPEPEFKRFIFDNERKGQRATDQHGYTRIKDHDKE
jgi:hypothetical protein